ncbi:ATP-binding cassette domain-containing protein [uncultured Microbacterium sp.]|uniref:ATP-binding cassette domain-containing protein n=1 Tax=uncultured Microbacterium sp. TaxID=191216 RepID=UPI0035CBC7BC
MSAVIETHAVHKSFGRSGHRIRVLEGLDLSVERGEVFALLGPNGSGKTTTISILTTLVKPDGGSAVVAGCDVVADPQGVTRRISLTGQSAAVDDMLTGIENLVMLGRLSGLAARDARLRADQLVETFDLADASARRVSTYSGGMRRRLDLALSLVTTPEVLFLDEPTTGLDTRSRRELWEVIRTISAAGTTVFLTTQYLEEADRLADRVAVLDGGKIVAQGTPGQLKERVGGARVEVRSPAGDLIAEIPTDGTVPGLRAALAAFDDADGSSTPGAASVTVHRPTLDDVFLALTGQPTAEPALSKGR